MPRSLKTILACVFLVSFLAIGFGAGPLHATTYLFSAVNNAGRGWSGFTLCYTDSYTVDGLFELGEMVQGSFSGVTFSSQAGVEPYQFTSIVAVPGYDPSASPLTSGPGGGELAVWVFGGCTNWGIPDGGVGVYAREFTEGQVVVPLPPTVFLLGSGLLGLAGWRRFRKV